MSIDLDHRHIPGHAQVEQSQHVLGDSASRGDQPCWSGYMIHVNIVYYCHKKAHLALGVLCHMHEQYQVELEDKGLRELSPSHLMTFFSFFLFILEDTPDIISFKVLEEGQGAIHPGERAPTAGNKKCGVSLFLFLFKCYTNKTTFTLVNCLCLHR